MAGQSLDQLRNQIVTSWYGRKDGMDVNEFEVGPRDLRVQVQVITTTSLSSAAAPSSGVAYFGITQLACTSGAGVYTMSGPNEAGIFGGPPPGIIKTIVQTCTSTAGFTIQVPSGVNISGTGGSSFNQMVFLSMGHTASLTAVSSALWALSAGAVAAGITLSTF